MKTGPALPALPAAVLLVILSGLALSLAGSSAGVLVWTVGLYLFGIPLVVRTTLGVIRGRLAADLVAALALATAMILREPVAGLVVALMQTGGEALERIAERRASRAVEGLEARAPRIAHRRSAVPGEPSRYSDVPVHQVLVDDTLMVRPGEMVPCDGVVLEGEAAVDISGVTGEPIPLAGQPGVRLPSGCVVLTGPLVIRVEAIAAESLYERIVDLVRTAQAHKAPLQRTADQVAVWFTPITLAVCAAAWIGAADPIRVLAVLVVATPCPMILATPVAIIGGINRAASAGIIVRHGGAMEELTRVTVSVFDKTGTLTLGEPEVARVEGMNSHSAEEVLSLAASLEEGASHPLARSVVRAARARGLLSLPAHDVREAPGRGVRGSVGAQRVIIGSQSLLREFEPTTLGAFEAVRNGRTGLQALVAIDGRAAGIVSFADRPRQNAVDVLKQMRELGFQRQVLLSGDDKASVLEVALQLGFTEVEGDLGPEDKAAYVQRLRREGLRVLVIGDGINDAPALASANVGIALAEHGGGITAQSADVVILENDLTRITTALRIARHAMRVARQSLAWGLGLSAVAMGFAAFGYVAPTVGALLQEGIDLAVILNALRAAGAPIRESG